MGFSINVPGLGSADHTAPSYDAFLLAKQWFAARQGFLDDDPDLGWFADRDIGEIEFALVQLVGSIVAHGVRYYPDPPYHFEKSELRLADKIAKSHAEYRLAPKIVKALAKAAK